MNATRWPSLTEFAKFVGREGICRVEETDKGLHIAWIDNSPEALRRQDALRKREMQDKGDEEREQRQIREQVERAQKNARVEEEQDDGARELNREEGEKIKLNFGTKLVTAVPKVATPPKVEHEEGNTDEPTTTITDATEPLSNEPGTKNIEAPREAVKMSFGMNLSSKPKNVFAVKKNPLGAKKSVFVEQPKKMSEAERIMKEEIERKRPREVGGQVGFSMKKQRVS